MKYLSVSGRRAWFALLLCGLSLIVIACGGDSATTRTASISSPVVVNSPNSGVTSTPVSASPTTAAAHPSPTASRPTPAQTPTTVPRTPTPTPTPTHVVPTPKPTPKPTPRPTPSPTPPPTVVVSITTDSSGSFTFSPSSLTIAPGTTVIWKNMTQVPHTVTSNSGAFDSGTISPGGSFSFKFTQAGSYSYHCQIHPFMTASVTVS